MYLFYPPVCLNHTVGHYFFGETSLKPNLFNFRLSKFKQNKYVMNDVVACVV